MAADQFADEIEHGHQPAALHGWDGTDEEKIEVDGDEEDDQFPFVREEKAEEKGAKGDQDREVEARNCEEMLQAEFAKFIAQ